MNKREYKKKFKNYIVNYCIAYNYELHSKKDLKWFNKIAKNEYDAVIELGGLDLDMPEIDAEECISCWDFET